MPNVIDEGAQARRDGKPLTANPCHPRAWQYGAWAMGWHREDARIREERR
jgi:hypothetical protein